MFDNDSCLRGGHRINIDYLIWHHNHFIRISFHWSESKYHVKWLAIAIPNSSLIRQPAANYCCCKDCCLVVVAWVLNKYTNNFTFIWIRFHLCIFFSDKYFSLRCCTFLSSTFWAYTFFYDAKNNSYFPFYALAVRIHVI